MAEFRHVDHQGDGGLVADTGDRREHFQAAGHARIGLHQFHRQKRTTQISLFDPDSVAATLETISAWLDNHPELLDAVAADLGAAHGKSRGRQGLSCESVLRCAVIRHLHQLSWRGLEFFLRDSQSTRRFVRLDRLRPPGKSALQASVGAVRAETWERINRVLLRAARAAGVETGERVRVDSTVTESHILAPTDSRSDRLRPAYSH